MASIRLEIITVTPVVIEIVSCISNTFGLTREMSRWLDLSRTADDKASVRNIIVDARAANTYSIILWGRWLDYYYYIGVHLCATSTLSVNFFNATVENRIYLISKYIARIRREMGRKNKHIRRREFAIMQY